MNIFKDMSIVYKKAAGETVSRIRKNPLVLAMPFLYSLILGISYNFVTIILGKTVGYTLIGFLAPIIFSLILSSYYELLSDICFYNKLGFKNFLGTFKKNASSIYSVYFIFIIIGWGLELLRVNYMASNLVNIILFFVFNSICEAIYIKGEYYTSAFKYTIEFIKENLIQWTLPLLIYLGIFELFIHPGGALTLMNGDVISFVTGYKVTIFDFMNIGLMASVVIVEVITAIYVVFRGALYRILSTSSMRKRLYMGEF